MHPGMGNVLLLVGLGLAGLVESLVTSRLSGDKTGGSYALFWAHFSPLAAGIMLLPLADARPHDERILLLLLCVSLALRLGWHASRRLGLRSCSIIFFAALAIVLLSRIIALPHSLTTAALPVGLFAISTNAHAIMRGRLITGRPNAVLFGAALAFIVFLDLGLGCSYWRWDVKLLGPGRGYTPDSLIRGLGVGFFDMPRDEEHKQVKLEANDGRILVIGGSSAAGLGVSKEERFQAVLGRDLAVEGRDIEVLNGAAGQYVSANMVLDAVEGYRLLEPDLVVLYMGFNDCGLMLRVNNQVGPARPVTEEPLLLSLLRHRPVYQLLDRLLAGYRQRLKPAEEMQEVSGAALADNMELLKEMYGESGARLILFLEATRERWPECRETVLAAAERAGIPVVDTDDILRAIFCSADDYLVDEVHPNPLGHWALAKIMEGELLDRGLIE